MKRIEIVTQIAAAIIVANAERKFLNVQDTVQSAGIIADQILQDDENHQARMGQEMKGRVI